MITPPEVSNDGTQGKRKRSWALFGAEQHEHGDMARRYHSSTSGSPCLANRSLLALRSSTRMMVRVSAATLRHGSPMHTIIDSRSDTGKSGCWMTRSLQGIRI